MTVEQDHVYYVGDFATLVHNACKLDANLGGEVGDGLDAAHLVPENKSGPIFDFMRNLLKMAKIDINDAVNGFLTNDARHMGTHTDEFYAYLFDALSNNSQSIEDALRHVMDVVSTGVFRWAISHAAQKSCRSKPFAKSGSTMCLSHIVRRIGFI